MLEFRPSITRIQIYQDSIYLDSITRIQIYQAPGWEMAQQNATRRHHNCGVVSRIGYQSVKDIIDSVREGSVLLDATGTGIL